MSDNLSSSSYIPAPIDWNSILNSGPASYNSSSSSSSAIDQGTGNPLLGPLKSDGTAAPTGFNGSLQSAAATPSQAEGAAQGAEDGSTSFFTSIGKDIGNITAQVQAAFGAGQTVADQNTKQQQAAAQAIIQAAQAQGGIDKQDATQKAAADALVAKRAAQVGLVGPDADKTAAAIDQRLKDVQSLADQRDQIAKVGFWDNPLTYIFNQVVKSPVIEAQLEAKAKDLSQLQQGLSSQQSFLSGQAQAASAIDSVNTTQRAAMLAQRDIQEGIANAAKPLNEAAQLKISAIDTSLKAAGIETQALETQAGLPLKAKQFQYYDALHSTQVAEREGKIAELNEYLKEAPIRELERQQEINKLNLQGQEVTGKLAEQSDWTKTVNLGLTSLGLKGVNSAMELAPRQREALKDIGLHTMMGGGLGNGPLASVGNLAKLNYSITNLPGAQAQTVGDIRNTESQMTQIGLQKNLKGTDLESFVNDSVAQAYVNRATAVQSDDPAVGDRLYKPAPLNTLRAQPWAKDNPILIGMEKYGIDGAGNVLRDAPFRYQDAMTTAIGLVSQGKLTIPQAQKAIAEIAKNSMNDNNVAYGFRRFDIPWDQTRQKVSLPRPGGIFGAQDTVDLLNPKDVISYLSKLNTVQQYKAIQEFGK